MTLLRASVLIFITTQIFAECKNDPATDLFNHYWDFVVKSNPEYATFVGDNRFNSKLKNYSIAHHEEIKKELIQFQENAIKLLMATRKDISRTNLEFLIEEIDFKLKWINARNYYFAVSFLDGPPNSLNDLISVQPMKSKEDFFNLVSRYNAFPKQVEEIITAMRDGIKVNMVQHERSFLNYEEMVEDFISETPENSSFYGPFQNISTFFAPEELDEYSRIAKIAISISINPALRNLSDFIKNEYLPHTRESIAASSLPDGLDYYNMVLKFYVNADVTPKAIHKTGIKEVTRLSKEMKKLIRSLGFRVNIRQFNDILRSNSSMYFISQEEVFRTYENVIHNEIEPKLPQFFKRVPNAELVITQVREQNSNAPIGSYTSSTTNNTTKGFFVINASDLPSIPKFVTTAFLLHETMPGHHFQVSYAYELGNLPMRRQSQYPLYAGFSEGWALYSEYLGEEMGLYKDPYMLYGRLSEEMIRAARMVIDTGIHVYGWTRNQAIEYMYKYTANSRKYIEDEIDRYITIPGQACAYKYGEMKIKQYRAEAEKKLGKKFNVKDFHDVILRNGGSFSFMEKQVYKYIAQAKT